MIARTRYIEVDVLVLGSGGAGLRASIEARKMGAEVALVSKAPVGMNNCTVVAGGGFRAAIDGFTTKEHFKDTIKVGKKLNDKKLVDIFTKEGRERILELRNYGVDINLRQAGASVGTIPTLMGLGITKPMSEHVRSIGIEIIENTIITNLLKKKNKVIGAVGYNIKNEEPITFSAKAIVLATGGAGALYKRTDCPIRTTGDGYSLGFHAGARLRDMEFVQFYPIALAESGEPLYLIGGAISEKGRIINGLGEDIPLKYKIKARPLVEKSRDLLSRAVMMEIMQGGGIEGAVFIDAREVFKNYTTEEIATTPTWKGITQFLVKKLKVSEKPFRVAPVSHFCMGGFVIDEYCYTGVPGLYAAGEVVGGIHGANRHGGNALTDIFVFGARAGAAAFEYSRNQKNYKVDLVAEAEIKRYESIVDRDQGYTSLYIMDKLRDVMWSKVGILRDSISLAEAFEELGDLRSFSSKIKAKEGRDMLSALELPMALDSAELIIRAAMERKESRGAHYRVDYPMEDTKWLKPIILSRSEFGAIRVEE